MKEENEKAAIEAAKKPYKAKKYDNTPSKIAPLLRRVRVLCPTK
jgi:hypothetical protein